MSKNKLSKYRGVTLDKRVGKYVARVTFPGRKIKYLGTFLSEIEAAEAYDKYVLDNNLPNKLNFFIKRILKCLMYMVASKTKKKANK